MKPMKKLLLITVLAILLIPAGIALASDITNALYHGIIRITNSGAATENVSVNMTLSVTGLSNSAFTDISIQYEGADVAFMPGYNSNPWAIFIAALGDNQTVDYDLYVGGVTGGKIRYFSGSGGMTTPDHPSIELGDNFTVEAKGWIDTTVSSNITSKEGAFALYTNSSGNVTADWNGVIASASGVSSGEHTVKATIEVR